MAPRPNTESCSFDSAYRLTNVAPQARARIDPALFSPPAAPVPEAAMAGQQAIDNAIGSLANPVSYTYRYDRAGNRLEERPGNGPPVTYTPNGLNEIASVDGTPLGYDANGNLLDDGRLAYRYNYRNQLVSAALQSSGAEVLRLSYDATGRLVRIDENGQVTQCVHDGLNVVEEYRGGALAASYVHEDGVDRRGQVAAAGNERWYHRDLAESTRWLSDAGGQFVAAARTDYEPFGAPTGPPNHDYLFAGLRFFPQAGLYHARARQYSPSLGRFIQRDPKGFVDGPNLYVYCGNNPVTFSDPLGTQKAGVQTPNQAGQSGDKVSSEILTTLGKQYESDPRRRPLVRAKSADRSPLVRLSLLEPVGIGRGPQISTDNRSESQRMQDEKAFQAEYNYRRYLREKYPDVPPESSWLLDRIDRRYEGAPFSYVVDRILPTFATSQTATTFGPQRTMAWGAPVDPPSGSTMLWNPSIGSIPAGERGKLDYAYGRATGSQHNLERTAEMNATLNKVNLPDTPANRLALANFLLAHRPDPTVVAYAQITRGVFDAPGGAVEVEMRWQGQTLATMILRPVK